MAEVRSLHLVGGLVRTSAGDVPSRDLIVAVGAETDCFGKQGVIRCGHGLRDLNDAAATRNTVLSRFEQAALEDDPIKRRALLSLAWLAAHHLERKRARIRLGTLVKDLDGDGVSLQGGERIEAKTLSWAAGIRAVPPVNSFGRPTARHGRLPVAPTLQLPGVPEAYLIGDAACLEDDGQPLPMMAPVAMQMADTAVENTIRQLEGRSATAFCYRSPGSLATIGRNTAVAHVHGVSFRVSPPGWSGWWYT